MRVKLKGFSLESHNYETHIQAIMIKVSFKMSHIFMTIHKTFRSKIT